MVDETLIELLLSVLCILKVQKKQPSLK